MSHKPFISQLVIVLAVIAFFSAIGLQLQRRAPVQDFDRFSRIASALEAYALDHGGQYPPHQDPGDPWTNYYLPNTLTTPIGYLNGSELLDPLASFSNPTLIKANRYRYMNLEMLYANSPTFKAARKAVYGEWFLWSPGYDQYTNGQIPGTFILYDATNGTFSEGDILRSQRMLLETGAE